MSSHPPGTNQPGLQLTRYHSGMADKHSALEQSLNKANVAESEQAVSKALREFEEFSRNDRERFLLGGLAQTGSDQAVCEWIAARYDHLGRISRAIVPYEIAPGTADKDKVGMARTWALAVMLTGHASKWRKIAGLRGDTAVRGRLHKLFVTAMMAGVDATILDVMVDRRSIETTVEALYVRALLLERFASGNLPPKRLEILDSWLMTWMGALWLSREPVIDGPSLAINTRNPTVGLTRFVPGDRADFFLGLRPLRRQLERAAADFHRGIIFPGWGIGLSFRMEEHVSLIDFLEREFALIESSGAQKSKRFSIGNVSDVSVIFGFNDIYARALQNQSTMGSSSVSERGAVNAPGDALSGAAARRASLSETGGFVQPRVGRQPINLLDISESGLGLEMDTEEASFVEVEELVAVRIEAGKPYVLGVVVRKTSAHQRSVTTVGVKVLSKVPLRATLEMLNDRLVRQSVKGIFVAGKAEHGFADSIIVTDAIYKTNPTLSVMVASGVFHLRLGRVRQQGPGWKMAAVEVRVAH
ncbi:MAG: hypothetical protein ABI905_14865 [Betaproteobacteria bacterium]